MTTASEWQDQGISAYQKKDYEASLSAFNNALEAYTADDDIAMANEMKINIGLVYRGQGEHMQALEIMQEAMAYFQETEDVIRAAKALGNIGGVYEQLDDREQAYTCYRQAADLFEEIGEKVMYGETMLAIGALQVKDGKFMKGSATYEIGLNNIDKRSAPQRLLNWVIGLRNRAMGS